MAEAVQDSEAVDAGSPYIIIAVRLLELFKQFDTFIGAAQKRICMKNLLLPAIRIVRHCEKMLHDYDTLPLVTRPHNTCRLEQCRNDLAMILLNLQNALTMNAVLLPHLPDQPLKPKNAPVQHSNLISNLYITKFLTHFAYQHLNVWLTYSKCVKEDQLHEAASQGEILPFFGVQRNPQLCSAISCKGSIIHSIIFGGDRKMLFKLFNTGVDLNAQDKFGNTPMMMASLFNEETLTRCFLARGASPNIANEFNQMPLAVAICRNNKETIKAIKKCGGLSETPDCFGMTPYDLALHFYNDPTIWSMIV